MKELIIPYIPAQTSLDIARVSAALSISEKHELTYSPWSDFVYRPHVDFAIAFNNEYIFLRYEVEEHVARAAYTKINQPVCKDSCVEFFIAFPDEDNYYNLEFNFAGNCLAGYGAGRANRKLLSVDQISKIRSVTNIKAGLHHQKPVIVWDLTLAIPLSIFEYSNITSLAGRTAQVNFYKCGDELPQPHYLCWNRIVSDTPDFHRPECFGKVTFNTY